MSTTPNSAQRTAEAEKDDIDIQAIEVSFSIPVYVTQDQQHRLWLLLREIVEAPVNQVDGCCHWLSGSGSKPHWSRQDALFLGKNPSDFAPDSGEPTFDDSVLYFETSFREKHPNE